MLTQSQGTTQLWRHSFPILQVPLSQPVWSRETSKYHMLQMDQRWIVYSQLSLAWSDSSCVCWLLTQPTARHLWGKSFPVVSQKSTVQSINNNSSQTGVSVFAWGSGALLLPFRPLHSAHLLLEKDRRSLLQASHRQQKEVPAFFLNFCLCPYMRHKWTMLRTAIEALGQK